jgi:hypothetical protein
VFEKGYSLGRDITYRPFREDRQHLMCEAKARQNNSASLLELQGRDLAWRVGGSVVSIAAPGSGTASRRARDHSPCRSESIPSSFSPGCVRAAYLSTFLLPCVLVQPCVQ